MYSVILCGGSGTRLWPLSRKNYPKQFLNLYNNHSLLQETFLRMKKIMPLKNIFFITNKENYFNALNQIKEKEKNFDERQILIEPKSLNTAPAITYAIKHLAEVERIGGEAPIIFLPSDHYIEREEDYLNIVEFALENINNHIGTIGITPKSGETGFGYIKKGAFINKFYYVEKFIEKPDKETAEKYVSSGQYIWNSGIYIFNIKAFAKELAKHSPEIYNLLAQDMKIFLKKFCALPSISIDCAISEKSDNVVTFEGDFGWNDVGSFDALAEILENRPNTSHVSLNSKNVFAHSESKKLIVTSGIDDLIVIENQDSILIQKKGESQNIKKIVDFLQKNKPEELEREIIAHRPWGKYEILIDAHDHKVKKTTIYPGAKLSLHSHLHRTEHWIVVKGSAKISNAGKEIIINENESAFIEKRSKHSLENPGKINLEIIEVQTGSYLKEDDTETFN